MHLPLINPFLLVILALGAFRLTRIVTTDAISEPIRQKIWSKFPPNTFLGYLITCNWCFGMYVAGLFTLGYFLVPDVTYVVSLVLSISSVIGLISNKLD
jgi:hypothetical protein